MIAVARPDHDAHHIAWPHREIFERPELHFRRILCGAGREALPGVPAPQFQRPRHAVAAFRMRVLHDALHAQRGCHRAAPADDYGEFRRRMDRDAVRLHVARDAHVLVGGIGEHAQSIRAGPSLDEIVALGFLQLLRQVRINARLARSNAQAVEPRRKHNRLDAMLLRQRNKRFFI